MPLLTRQGCNAGACHGSASGRGGFKLSLLGSDPASDYDAIVREFEGRRVNTIHPWASLLLRKPSEQLSHEGGMRLADDTAAFALLQRWIAQGARRGSVRGLRSLTLTPADV